MRVVLSRKGFDTGSGGAASPIVSGHPISVPIPTRHRSVTTFEHLGLGEIVERITRGKISRDHLCHEDPMFIEGRCLFGQSGAAQSHLRNKGVGIGDVFLFFGLFAEEQTGERHHRIFGYLKVEDMIQPRHQAFVSPHRPHPHTLGEWNSNNTIYIGEAMVATKDHAVLRLTQPNGPLRHWIVPSWLKEIELSFHGKPERWLANSRLEVVARGQEFVADIGDEPRARHWLSGIIEAIRS